MSKKEQKESEKTQEEHLMEKFPMPQGMPAEWHEHEPKLINEKKAEAAAKAIEEDVKFTDDAEKEAHLIEKFPAPKTEPEEWHCRRCPDGEK
ncbi:MAG: hypothetical protein GY755_03415 [Chloroflexi bacterium]|nr:hypothetical protein [Chloroflexota bacterium]